MMVVMVATESDVMFLKRICAMFLLVVGIIGRPDSRISAQDIAPILTAYVAWHPNGQYIAVSTPEAVKIIKVTEHTVLHSFVLDNVFASPPVWSPDGLYLGFGLWPEFEIWSDPIGTPILEARYELVVGSGAAAWSPSGELIAIADGPYVKVWEMTSGKQRARMTTDLTASAMSSIDWNDTESELLVSQGQYVHIFDYPAATLRKTLLLESFVNARGFYINPSAVASWSPSHSQIAIGSDDTITVFEGDEITKEFCLISYNSPALGTGVIEGPVPSIAWHPDGVYLANSGSDGTIRIWNVKNGENVYSIEFPENVIIESVAWSPDGNYLAYGAPDGSSDAVLISTGDILPKAAIMPSPTTSTIYPDMSVCP